MKWLVRAVATIVAGVLALCVARACIHLPASPQPGDYQFSGLLILGGNVLFAVLDFYSAQYSQRADQLVGLPGVQTRLARTLREGTLAARRNVSFVVTVATGLKGIGAICGLLITQRALAPEHYPWARDVGFFTLGAALPTIIILWRSVRRAERTLEGLTRLLEEERDRKTDLEALRTSHP